MRVSIEKRYHYFMQPECYSKRSILIKYDSWRRKCEEIESDQLDFWTYAPIMVGKEVYAVARPNLAAFHIDLKSA